MKRYLYILMVVLLSGAFFPIQPYAQAKTINISLAHWGAKDALVHWGIAEPWKKLVEERTDGKVKVTIYPAQSLAKTRDLYPAAVSGIADVTIGFMAHYPGHSPRSTVMELPFMGITSAAVSSHVIQDLSKTLAKDDYNDVKVLWLFCFSNSVLHTKKPVRRLEDLKGMKIRTGGDIQSRSIKLLGGAPVTMSPSDIYVSLEKKVVDGALFPWEAVWGFKMAEVVGYHTVVNMQPVGPFYVVMNLKKWESLPADIKKIIDEVSGNNGVDFTVKAMAKADKQGIDFALEKGNEIIELQTAEINRLRENCKPIYDKWLNDMQSQGINGQALIDETNKLVNKYSYLYK